MLVVHSADVISLFALNPVYTLSLCSQIIANHFYQLLSHSQHIAPSKFNDVFSKPRFVKVVPHLK